MIKKDSLRPLKLEDPSFYLDLVDRLKTEAETEGCGTAALLLQLIINTEKVRYGRIKFDVLFEFLETNWARLDLSNEAYHEAALRILTLQCSFQAHNYGNFVDNKCLQLKQALASFRQYSGISEDDIQKAYINLIRLLPDTNADLSKIEDIFSEAIEFINKKDSSYTIDAYTEIGHFYAKNKRDYLTAFEYFEKAKLRIPFANDMSYSEYQLKKNEFLFQLKLYPSIINEYDQLDISKLSPVHLFQLSTIIAWAYYEVKDYEKAELLLQEVRTIGDKHRINKNPYFFSIYLLEVQLEEIKAKSEEALRNLELKYLSYDHDRIPDVKAIMLHHIMRIEHQLGKTTYNTLNNHQEVLEILRKKMLYPFKDNNIIISEIEYLRDYYSSEGNSETLLYYQDLAIEFIKNNDLKTEAAKFLEKRSQDLKRENESLSIKINLSESLLNEKSNVVKWIAGLLLFAIVLAIYFFQRNRKNIAQRKETVLLNKMTIERAKDYKNLYEEQQTIFNYMAHDIRGPLNRLIQNQTKLIKTNNSRETKVLKEKNERLTEEINIIIDRMNSTLYATSVKELDLKERINLVEHIQRAEELISPSLLKSYSTYFEGTKTINSYSQSLLILLKNCLENALKHSSGSHVNIELKVLSIIEGTTFEFISNKTSELSNHDSSVFTISSSGYGLGLQICKAIALEHNGWLKVEENEHQFKVQFCLK